MAERYGGRFSPGAKGSAPAPDMRRRSRAGGRVNALFLAPAPLAILAFFQSPTGLALDLGGFFLLIAAAWLTREGILAEEAYEARSVARRPAIPRKMMASIATGAGLALAAYNPGASPILAILLGLIGLGLHAMAFGLDPMKNKGMEGVSTFDTERVARAVDEAETHLAAMSDAIARLRDRDLTARVAKFQTAARQMFRTVENDPRDLTAARRYLGVYLLGARDATLKFTELTARSADPEARSDYLALLDDLESSFAQRTEKLLQDDKTGLDIEIEVLRERLDREAVRHNS